MCRRAAVAIALAAAVALQAGPSLALRPELADQLEALLAEKAQRGPIERKLDSALLYALRARRGDPPVPGVPSLRAPTLELDAEGRCAVDVRGGITARLRERLIREGGRMIASFPAQRRMRARVRVRALLALASLPEVTSIRRALPPETRKLDTSEGDVAHTADALRTRFAVDGSGVTVGVLSDGVDSLGTLQGSGDLPANVTVIQNGLGQLQAGSGSEGTAMLEIVHDLAPGADLLFATALGGEANFANNILLLRAAGADVIIDDVFYFSEPTFQDGIVAAAADAVAADGALYFSSAGNSGNLGDGTSGVWEGDYASSGFVLNAPPLFDATPIHTFGGGSISNVITGDSPSFFILQWSDPEAGAANDYDLVLLDAAESTILAASTNPQTGFQDPFEFISSETSNDAGNRLMVVRLAGSGRFLHLNTNRGRLQIATDGQTAGHAAARGALGVAAVDARDAGPGGVFDGAESVETFSSDGPRRVFFESDGSAITPGNFSSTGGELRAKPDLAAADCVSTATPGFGTFCGTSAAAPHAGALAALLLQLGAPVGAGPDEVVAALLGTALDIEAPGDDRDSGAGLLTAEAAALALGPVQCANGIDDDGDGAVDFPDDTGCLSADDPDEREATVACDDGLDNDGDGAIDFPADPGCVVPAGITEAPACQDGIDNDGDTGIDFDGGASANGGVPLAAADPQCSEPYLAFEKMTTCGTGFELLPLLVVLDRLRRRRRRHAGVGDR